MAGATDVGMKRKANQDSLFFDQALGIGIVADGIGGRKGGEIASSIAVNEVRKAYVNADRIRHEEIHPFLMTAVDTANRKILAKGEQSPEIKGMGTTLNCLMFLGEVLHLAHIGDSRTYLHYDDQLWQLTIDHNVKTFVEKGWMDPKQGDNPIGDSALVRALGLFDNLEMDFYQKKVNPGEIFVTSSDGLFDMVSDRKINEIICNYKDNLDQLPHKLIAEANKRGGKDNITVLISKVVD